MPLWRCRTRGEPGFRDWPSPVHIGWAQEREVVVEHPLDAAQDSIQISLERSINVLFIAKFQVKSVAIAITIYVDQLIVSLYDYDTYFSEYCIRDVKYCLTCRTVSDSV